MLKVKSTDKLTLTENNPVIYFSNWINSQQRNDSKSIKLNRTTNWFFTQCSKLIVIKLIFWTAAISSPSYKKGINKLRLSQSENHRLRIETGRQTIPKIPENLRIFFSRHLNEVENELHFILFPVTFTIIYAWPFLKQTIILMFIMRDQKFLFFSITFTPISVYLQPVSIHSCLDYGKKTITSVTQF